MIKQIQLRGISHSPSDRLTADGGVEECIDLRLEDQEHGPAKEPLDVTDELADDLSESGIDVMYIHKTNAYFNYVGTKVYHDSDNDEDVTWLAAYVKVGSTWEPKQIHALGDDSVISITSIGNMLVYTLSDGKTYYALYKDGAYLDLGSEIPRPNVYFVNQPHADTDLDGTFNITQNNYPTLRTRIVDDSMDTKKFWAYVIDNKEGIDEAGDFLSMASDYVWERVDKQRKQNLEDKVFSAPVLARYALRLYDGTYLYPSEPILLAGSTSHLFVSNMIAELGKVTGQPLDGDPRFLLFTLKLRQQFGVKVTASIEDASKWKDIISSVDIFLSTDIMLPNRGTFLSGAANSIDGPNWPASGMDHLGAPVTINYKGLEYIETEGSSTGSREWILREAFEAEMLKKVNFYEVASYSLDKLPTNEDLKPYTQDELVVRKQLEEGEPHAFSGIGNIGAYNNRLVLGGQHVRLSPGHNAPHAAIPATGSLNNYAIYYHVRDTDGGEHIVQGYSVSYIPSGIRAYVAYPDPKCFQADLYFEVGGVLSKVILPMHEHERMNCAYGFWGLDYQLDTPGSSDGRSTETATSLPAENPTYDINNRLALSEMDNPFVFPLGQRERFTARILQVVPATIALSANQSGPFPLYIFTEDGIWAESVNAEGGLSNKLVVSRDVAVEGTVTQLDRAVVFVSGQGIMYLEGNQVAFLSPYMNGPQYTIAEFAPTGSSLRTALTRNGFGALLDISVDTTDFQDFALACKPLYDYANRRILFFKGDEDYGYEYALDTQTWHKVSVPAAFIRTLNGYPQALAVFGSAIYEWSVRHDYNAASPASRKGWLLTRPFDLDAPDIRKAIRSIRIRGVFKRNGVRYLLFGSFDGINWQRLTSLRGGSYKMFRLLLLTDLTPEERISWIDVDYETRFQTKLR